MPDRHLQRQIVVRVPQETFDQLHEWATEQDRTITQEVRRAIRLYLAGGCQEV